MHSRCICSIDCFSSRGSRICYNTVSKPPNVPTIPTYADSAKDAIDIMLMVLDILQTSSFEACSSEQTTGIIDAGEFSAGEVAQISLGRMEAIPALSTQASQAMHQFSLAAQPMLAGLTSAPPETRTKCRWLHYYYAKVLSRTAVYDSSEGWKEKKIYHRNLCGTKVQEVH